MCVCVYIYIYIYIYSFITYPVYCVLFNRAVTYVVGTLQSCRLWSSVCRVSGGTSSCMAVETNPRFAQSVAALAHKIICILWFCGNNVFVLITSFPPGLLVLGSIAHGRLSPLRLRDTLITIIYLIYNELYTYI